MNEYPRVLLINYEPISKRKATGITMGNLFKGWPKSQIAQIYIDDSEPDVDICEQSWRLEIEDIMLFLPIKKIIKGWRISRLRRKNNVENNLNVTTSIGSTDGKYIIYRKRLLNIFTMLFFKFHELSQYGISKDLKKFIDDFRPQIIYSVLGNIHIIQLNRKISSQYKIPIVPHIMDDWSEAYYRGELLSPLLRFKMMYGLKKIMKDAPVAMTIGETMAEEYHKRYQRDFIPFMNCVDVNKYDSVDKLKPRKNEFRFVYTGGLHLGRWEMILDIGRALDKLSSEGIKATIDIYSAKVPVDNTVQLYAKNIIKICEYIEPENIPDIIKNCDGLIHVDSFEEKLKVYTKYSLSTKLPEYFLSGTPIFAYGPNDIESIQYLKKNNVGYIVDERNMSKLYEGLKQFITVKLLKEQYVKNARNIALEKHDSLQQRKTFQSIIIQSAVVS